MATPTPIIPNPTTTNIGPYTRLLVHVSGSSLLKKTGWEVEIVARLCCLFGLFDLVNFLQPKTDSWTIKSVTYCIPGNEGQDNEKAACKEVLCGFQLKVTLSSHLQWWGGVQEPRVWLEQNWTPEVVFFKIRIRSIQDLILPGGQTTGSRRPSCRESCSMRIFGCCLAWPLPPSRSSLPSWHLWPFGLASRSRPEWETC